MAKPNGYVLWRGPSRIDGSPVVVIATGFAKNSDNSKTGDMIQTWILREDIHPSEATATGEDYSICGNCPHRPALDGDCYVKVAWAPAAVWKAYHKGRYPDHTGDIGKGRRWRFGSYGDPGAVPGTVWSFYSILADGWTGYTHQWRTRPDLIPFCMASVDSTQERIEAEALGWRTFRVSDGLEELEKGVELLCPASAEAGKRTTCAKCGLCSGRSLKAEAAPSINIPNHG